MNLRDKLKFWMALNRFVETIVSGVAPISLTQARANGLLELKAFGGTQFVSETYIDEVTAQGKCEQTGTPTPANPVDIVCNNGIIKARTALPLSYTQLDYLESTGTQYIDTGVLVETASDLTGTTVDFLVILLINNQANVCGAIVNSGDYPYTNTQAGVYNSLFMSASYGFDYSHDDITKRATATCNGQGSATPNCTFILFGRNRNTLGAQPYGRIRIYGSKIYKNNVLVRELIPAKRNSDSVLGMYDIVNDTFYTNAGSGTFVAGAESRKYYADGTQETVTDAQGNVASCEMLLSVGDYTDEQEVISGAVTRKTGVRVFDGTELWIALSTTRFELEILDAEKDPNNPIYCTHYAYNASSITGDVCRISLGGFFIANLDTEYASAADYKAWLADQYNAGTPVIVVYPLATETTESVTGQFLSKSPVTYAGSLTGLTGTVTETSHTTPTPAQPLDIVCNNGVMEHSKNLVAGAYAGAITSGVPYITPKPAVEVTSPYQSNTGWSGVVFVAPVKPNTAYVFSGNKNVNYVHLATYETFEDCYYSTRSLSSKSLINDPTFTTPADAHWALVSLVNSSASTITFSDIQIEEGSTATSYEPHNSLSVSGTQETINVHGKNLLDANVASISTTKLPSSDVMIDFTKWYAGVAFNGYMNDTNVSGFSYGVGTITFTSIDAAYGCVRFVKLKPSTTYTVSCASPTANHKAAIMCYNDNGDGTYKATTQIQTPTYLPYSFTTNADPTKIYGILLYTTVNTEITYSEIQLEEGSTATDYEAYFNGGTATAEMLLKVGTYTDEQEVINGGVTRKVGAKVLDGTENWVVISGTYSYFRADFNEDFSNVNSTNCLASHFPYAAIGISSNLQGFRFYSYNTQNSVFIRYDAICAATSANIPVFKQWLADQYANGTPVILVYPLGTETTETVTAQALTTQEGDNVADITQASMSGLELEVKYLKHV